MNNMNTMPFASTPLSPQSESMQTMPALFPTRPSMQSALPPALTDELDNLYPEIYREVYPLIANAADKMIAAGYSPTPGTIGLAVDNIIKNSGLWYEDDDSFDMSPEAVPVQYSFGRTPFGRRRRRHHNRDTLRDVIRILLLRELLGSRQGFPRAY